jgi:ribosome biogenesis GTPase A
VKKVDVVVEVRDARIPASTTHPSIPQWVGPHKNIIVVSVRV